MLKTNQIFVLCKTFAIIFAYECHTKTETYQSFENALSSKYYICCRFAQNYSCKYRRSNSMFRVVLSQFGEKHECKIYSTANSICQKWWYCSVNI